MSTRTLVGALSLTIAWTSVSAWVTVPRGILRRSFPRRGTTPSMSGLLQQDTGKASIDPVVFNKYRDIPLEEGSDVMAEYCWIDAVGGVRSKTRTLTLSKLKNGAGGLPAWNCELSLCTQPPLQSDQTRTLTLLPLTPNRRRKQH